MNNLSNIFVSLFETKSSVAKTTPLMTILSRIQGGEYRTLSDSLQHVLEPHEPYSDAWKEAKRKWKVYNRVPCVTTNCVIHEGLTRSDANIDHMNPLVCLDFDGQDQPDLERFSHFKEYVREKPFVLACGASISKTGYFLLALTDSTDKALFKPIFQALVDEFAKDGFIADRAASSLSNYRFVSHDPDLYINPAATPFQPPYPLKGEQSASLKPEQSSPLTPEQSASTSLKPSPTQPPFPAQSRWSETPRSAAISDQSASSLSPRSAAILRRGPLPTPPEEKKAYEKPDITVRTLDEEYERIEQILRENPNPGIADSYYNWFQVGLAFVDTFGEKGRPLFHQYSALSAKYNPSQCDRKYTSLLRSSRGCHTLATFYHVLAP